jgi:hypothetical protein
MTLRQRHRDAVSVVSHRQRIELNTAALELPAAKTSDRTGCGNRHDPRRRPQRSAVRGAERQLLAGSEVRAGSLASGLPSQRPRYPERRSNQPGLSPRLWSSRGTWGHADRAGLGSFAPSWRVP